MKNNMLGKSVEKSESIDLNIGSILMKVEGKPVLKGTFTYLSAFSQLFSQLEEKQGIDDSLVNAFVWSLCHAIDAEGKPHDIMVNLKHTKMFESLPMDCLLASETFHSAKVLMLSVLVRYFSAEELKLVTERVDNLITLFEKAKGCYFGLMQQYIDQALVHIKSKSDPVACVHYDEVAENPFQLVFDEIKLGFDEEIELDGVKLRKASIGRLLKSAQYFDQGDVDQTVILINEAMHKLMSEKFRFFDYFSGYRLWLSRNNNGLIFIYAIYLNYIFSKQQQSKMDELGKRYIQQHLADFDESLKQAVLAHTVIFFE